MPRYFTLPQAQAVLPHMEDLLREAISLRSTVADVEAGLRTEAERIRFSGGAMVHREKLTDALQHRESLLTQLRAAVEMIQEQGCLVKDLDQGLLDFPTLFRGEEVYLCWKMGEPSIGFWHAISDGFAGRQAIDQEFLDNHSSEL